jgi:26S proteasome regulatory subunit N7
MGDPQFAKYPDLQLAQSIFQLTNPAASKTAKQSSLKSVEDAITEHKMAPLYRYLAHPVDGVLNAPGEGSAEQPTTTRRPSASLANMLATRNPSLEVPLSWDEKRYESLKAENEKELEAIQKEEDEAAEKAGETEVQAARGKRAELYNRIGDKVRYNTSDTCNMKLTVTRTKPSQATRPSSRRRASSVPRLT